LALFPITNSAENQFLNYYRHLLVQIGTNIFLEYIT